MSAPSTSEERTPLLQDLTDGNVPPAEANQRNAQDTASEQSRQNSWNRLILKLFWLVVVTGGLSVPFNIASFVLGEIGSEKYDYFDYYYEMERPRYALLMIVSLLLALGNVMWLRRYSHSFKDVLNIVLSAWLGVAIVAYMGTEIGDRLGSNRHYCRNERLSPGKAEKCEDWALQYNITNWFCLVLAFISGTFLAINALVILIRTCNFRSPRSADAGVSRWRLSVPTLQLSLQIDLRLGSHGSGRDNSSTNEGNSATA